MNTANRVMWSVIGVILMAVGVVGALMSLGHLPGTHRQGRLVTSGDTAQWHSWSGWAAAVLVIAGLVVAAAGAALIRAELRRRRGRRLPDVVFTHPADERTPDGRPIRGRIEVGGGTLRHALQRDLQNNPGIARASVELTGHPQAPRLRLWLQMAPGADLTSVHTDVAAALTRFGTTSQLHPTLTETTISGA